MPAKIVPGRNALRSISGRKAAEDHARSQGPLRGERSSNPPFGDSIIYILLAYTSTVEQCDFVGKWGWRRTFKKWCWEEHPRKWCPEKHPGKWCWRLRARRPKEKREVPQDKKRKRDGRSLFLVSEANSRKWFFSVLPSDQRVLDFKLKAELCERVMRIGLGRTRCWMEFRRICGLIRWTVDHWRTTLSSERTPLLRSEMLNQVNDGEWRFLGNW